MRNTAYTAALLLLCANIYAQQTVVDTLDFDKMGATSPAELLRGKVSGARVSTTDGGVNGMLNTSIRGINSIRTSSEALWIIDGTILTSAQAVNLDAFWQEDKYPEMSYTSQCNPLSFINPYDIESIEVLKDASATAIYGSQGANGVIIVKTKMSSITTDALKINSNMGVGNNGRISHNHNISYSGKKNGNAYRFSGFFRNKQGAFQKENDLNGGLSVNFDSKTNNVVWFGLRTNIGIGDTHSLSGTNWYNQESAMTHYRVNGINAAYNDDYDDNGREYRAVNNIYLRINILKNLHWITDFGADYDNATRYIWYGNGTVLGKSKNGAAAIVNSSCLEYNLSTKVEYDVFILKSHHLKALAGVQLGGESNKYNTMNGNDYFSHELRARGLSYNADGVINHRFNTEVRKFAAFGQLSYDFKSYAGFDGTFRADNVKRYDDGKFVLYPAVEAWVDLHKFFEGSKAVSALKLNGGWGKSGRDTYLPVTEFSYAVPGLNSFIQPDVETLYEGLSRVISSEWNVGFNVGFISDRISLGAKYYERLSDDAFHLYAFGEPINGTIRWRKTDRNEQESFSSSFRNRGIELDLNAIILKGKDYEWTLDANLAFQSNQLRSVAEQDRYSSNIGKGIVSNYNETGYSVNALLGYQTDASGAIIDQTGDGIITAADRVIVGRTSPTLFGGLNTRFRWRNIAAYLTIDGAAGNQILNMNRMAADSVFDISDKYVENGDFLRIGCIGASYTFNFNTNWIKALRISLSGTNLFTISSYSGLNPDVDSFSKMSRTRGIDYGSFPILKSGILGVSLTF